jgi:CHAT domain
VQWEARLIRDLFYAGQGAGLSRFVPVVLPGCSAADIPLWLGPAATTHYLVGEYTVAGAEGLLRLLTGQPREVVPLLGPVPVLAPRQAAASAGVPGRAGLHTEVVIETALVAGGVLESATWVAGSLLARRRELLAPQVMSVWPALRLPAVVAGERMAQAGRALAGALLAEADQQLLAGLLDRLAPGDTAEVVLSGAGEALSLPAELIRLRAGGGVPPLGLMPGVSVSRRPAAPGRDLGAALPAAPSLVPGLAGPLKVLAAVAAPDETRTVNAPLDAEAEMAAVLDAVAPVAGGPGAQVRILEVASLPAIRQALAEDAYHVLHLSAHGSPELVELEDEDGGPVAVTPGTLMGVLRHAGRAVPLVVLSSCSGGAAGSQAMAAGLIGRGADRVIAMLAPVTDQYATVLARHLYRELAAGPGLTAGQALARARYLAEETRSQAAGPGRVPAPEYGVATLLAAAGDGPLVDPAAEPVPLTAATTPPGGKLVRDLPMGTLIGRRAQMRTAMAVLRRTPQAVDRFGVSGGVVLTGVGGIGKTAVAGRVIARLRDEGWLVAVQRAGGTPPP